MNIGLGFLAALTNNAVKSSVTVLGIGDRVSRYPITGIGVYFP